MSLGVSLRTHSARVEYVEHIYSLSAQGWDWGVLKYSLWRAILKSYECDAVSGVIALAIDLGFTEARDFQSAWCAITTYTRKCAHNDLYWVEL